MSDPKYDTIGDVLDKLVEECAEVIQVCAKIWRFGPYNYHPQDNEKTPNYELLRREIDDLEKRIEEAYRWIVMCQLNEEANQDADSMGNLKK